jgi:hypothetical protein
MFCAAVVMQWAAGKRGGVAESGCGSSSFGSSKIRSEMISAEKALNLMRQRVR